MADKPKPVTKPASRITRPGDLYIPGDRLPVPDVEEKNTDSVWALWSDLVEDKPREPAPEHDKPSSERDFLETVPLDLDALRESQSMDLSPPPRRYDK